PTKKFLGYSDDAAFRERNKMEDFLNLGKMSIGPFANRFHGSGNIEAGIIKRIVGGLDRLDRFRVLAATLKTDAVDAAELRVPAADQRKGWNIFSDFRAATDHAEHSDEAKL